jgi:hypothetical protein
MKEYFIGRFLCGIYMALSREYELVGVLLVTASYIALCRHLCDGVNLQLAYTNVAFLFRLPINKITWCWKHLTRYTSIDVKGHRNTFRATR